MVAPEVVGMRMGGYVAGAAALGYGGLYLLGRCAGSTAPERAALLPGD